MRGVVRLVAAASLVAACGGAAGTNPPARPSADAARPDGFVGGRSRGLVLGSSDTSAAASLAPVTSAVYARRRALVVGIDAYSPPFPPLGAAISDSRRVEAALQGLGFDEVLTLRDGEATRAAILDRIEKQIGPKTAAHDLVVVYFAGHGTTKNGQGYLIPYDARPGALEESALSVQRLKDAAFQLASLHVLFVVDACFAGTLFQKKPASGSVNPLAYWQALGEGRVVQVLAAGRQDEEAIESAEGGAFTTAFIAGVRGAADANHDALVTVAELGPFLGARVEAWSRGKQHPQWGNLEGDGSVSLYHALAATRRVRPAPTGLEAAFASARELVESRQYDKAEESLRRLSLGAAHPEIYLFLAEVYLHQDALGNAKLIDAELARAERLPINAAARDWLMDLRAQAERARRGSL